MAQSMLRQQYQTDANLTARIDLHRRFSANPYPWHRWVFDHLALPADARVLELGCGPADLWRENAGRIPAGWDITLTDFSEGMVAAAQRNLAEIGRTFHFPPGRRAGVALRGGNLRCRDRQSHALPRPGPATRFRRDSPRA